MTIRPLDEWMLDEWVLDGWMGAKGRAMIQPGDLGSESRMLIDGKLVEADSGRTFANINPATEQPLGHVADAAPSDMRRAIDAARRAFDETGWATDRARRRRCLEQLQAALEREREALREELIAEVGCPRMSTDAQVDGPLDNNLRRPIELLDRFSWITELPDAEVMGTATTRQLWKEPVGVVGAIAPNNFPLEVALHKLGQALATGNTVVLKPAPATPFHATRIGRLVAEQTDIPPGVVNVVTAADDLLGEELTRSPLVDLVSFTGSATVGKQVMARSANTLKRTFLELGGKSATIILDDAELDLPLMMGMSACYHAGQGDALQTRMLVPRARYDEAVEMLTGLFANVPYGDPQRPDVMMGPLVSSSQRDRVLALIAQGVRDGARLAVGGGRPSHLPTGWFVEPTLFVDVDNSTAIAQEEIFGPVLCVIAHDGDDDAVRLANDSVYGLSGGVFSGSFDRALGIAQRIRTGTFSVNGGIPFGADVPFGGYKHSGIGRQNAEAGFEEHLETKVVAWPRA